MGNKDIVLDIHENIKKYKNTIDILYLSTEYYKELDTVGIEYILHSYLKNNFVYQKNQPKSINNNAFLNFIYFLDNNKHLLPYALNDNILFELDINSLFKLHSLFVYYIQNDISIDKLSSTETITKISDRIISLLNKRIIFNNLDNFFVFCLYHDIDIKGYENLFIANPTLEMSDTIINFIKPGNKPNLNLNIDFIIDIIVPIKNKTNLFFEYLFFEENLIYDKKELSNKNLNNKKFIYEYLLKEIGYEEYIQFILKSSIKKYSFVNSASPFSFDIHIHNNNIEFTKTEHELNNILLCKKLTLEDKLLFLNSLDFNSEDNQHFIFIWLISNINNLDIIKDLNVLKFKVNSFIFNFAQGSYDKLDIFKDNKEYFNSIFKKNILKLVKNDIHYSMKNIFNYLSKHNQIDIFKMFLFFNSVLNNKEIFQIIEKGKYENIRDFILKKEIDQDNKNTSNKIGDFLIMEKLINENKIRKVIIDISIENKDVLLFKKLIPYEDFKGSNKIIYKQAIKFISDNLDVFYNIHFEYFIHTFFYMYDNKYLSDNKFKYYLQESLNENQYCISSSLFDFLRLWVNSNKFDKNLLLSDNIKWDSKIFILLHFLKHSQYKKKLKINDKEISNMVLELIYNNKNSLLFNINIISKIVSTIGNHNVSEDIKYILINYIDKYNDIEFVKRVLNIAETINTAEVDEKYKDEFFFLTHNSKNDSVEDIFKI